MKALIILTVLFASSIVNPQTACQENRFSWERTILKLPVLDLNKGEIYARTQNSAEQYKCVFCPDKINMDLRRVVFSIKIKGIKKGDIFQFNGWAQVTNHMPKPMMISWYFTLIDYGPTSFKGGAELTKARGVNVWPSTHHFVFGASGLWKAKRDRPIGYLNFVVYGVSGENSLTNEYMEIDLGYGEMSVFVQKTN